MLDKLIVHSNTITTAEELLKESQYWFPTSYEATYIGKPNNLTSNNKKMSLIKKAFQSKESKAVQNLDLGENKNSLNNEGQFEFVQYLYETNKDAKKGFLAKLVELDKENK